MIRKVQSDQYVSALAKKREKSEGVRRPVRSLSTQEAHFRALEEQKRLYEELSFFAFPGMRKESITHQRDRRKSSQSTVSLQQAIQQALGLADRSESESLLSPALDALRLPGMTFSLFLSCAVASIGGFQCGYNAGVVNAPKEVIFPDHSELQWSMVVSFFCIGAPIGAYFAGDLSNALGRRRLILLNSFVFIVAGLAMALSVDIWMLIAARILVGVASGCGAVVVPLYLGETAPPNLRGVAGSFFQLFCTIGILVADLFSFPWARPCTSLLDPGWRLLLGMTAVAGIIQILCAPLLPESPRWLLLQRRTLDASVALKYLRNASDEDVDEEVESILVASDQEQVNVSIRSLVQALQVAQQLSGINAVFYYSNTFFANVGLSNPLLGSTFVAVINMIATGVAVVFMDKFGRRTLLLLSSSGMFFFTVNILLSRSHILPLSVSATSLMATGAMMGFVFMFAIGLGPIPWLMVAEMFPSHERATAVSIATIVNWFCNFLVGIGFPFLQESLQERAFVPFGVIQLLTIFIVGKFVIETKGKALEEIQEALRGNSKAENAPNEQKA